MGYHVLGQTIAALLWRWRGHSEDDEMGRGKGQATIELIDTSSRALVSSRLTRPVDFTAMSGIRPNGEELVANAADRDRGDRVEYFASIGP
jgi:hypothetical protein